jgi:hypothetical protein
MNRNFKVPSKILHKLETERENKRLYLELNNIKPTMSFSLPRDCSHLKINKKRDQLREGKPYSDRYTEIERENRILLEKINNIIQKRQSKANKYQIKHSLNFPMRARHQREISLQNLGLLKRLQSKKSFYSFCNPSGDNSRKKQGKIEDLSPSYSRNSEAFPVKKLEPIPREKVYLTKVNLQDKIFNVEVLKGKKVEVRVENEQTEEKFILSLNRKEVRNLVGKQENWQKLVNFLHIEGNDLILCDPSDSELIYSK